MKTAVYARELSDKKDVDLSMPKQLKELREYAARNGYVIVKEFVDKMECNI